MPNNENIVIYTDFRADFHKMSLEGGGAQVMMGNNGVFNENPFHIIIFIFLHLVHYL